jgi:hypothetical protein
MYEMVKKYCIDRLKWIFSLLKNQIYLMLVFFEPKGTLKLPHQTIVGANK